MTNSFSFPAIKVKNLTKAYANKKVVDNVSLTVQRGEIYGFFRAKRKW